MQTIFSFLPKKIAEQLQHMPPSRLNKIEEINDKEDIRMEEDNENKN